MHRRVDMVSPEEEAQLLTLAEKHRITSLRILIEAALGEGTKNPSEQRDHFIQLPTLQRPVGPSLTPVRLSAAEGLGEDHAPC